VEVSCVIAEIGSIFPDPVVPCIWEFTESSSLATVLAPDT
jgi:hypothetical protein